LTEALKSLRAQLPVSVPKSAAQTGQDELSTVMPSELQTTFAKYTPHTKQEVSDLIESALQAKQSWQDMPFHDRAAIFLRAAELVSGKYRFDLIAATMLGQGKNAWQGEIDAAAELADFYRYNVAYAQEIYEKQPAVNAPGQAG
jgi:1-pyrroline-5-carboxylate dehydrogenase